MRLKSMERGVGKKRKALHARIIARRGEKEYKKMSLAPKSTLGRSRPGYCDGVKGSPRPGRRSGVTEAEVTGKAESDELKGSGRESVGFID